MKRFKIVILSQAQNDLRHAIDYYKKIDIKLARRFLKTTKATVNDLKKMPLFQIKYDQIRLRIIEKFPHTIHYIVDENNHTVFIYGIRHAASDPKMWPKR